MKWYTDGTLMGSNERQNIVWGFVPISMTASGTLPTNVRLIAVLQSKPSTVYISATTAEQDVYEATNYYPPDASLKKTFVPVARTILRPSTPAFEQFGSTAYYKDLRGKITSGGGAATPVDTSQFLLLDGSRSMAGNLTMGGNYINGLSTITGVYQFYTGSVAGNVANMTIVNGIVTNVGVYP